MAVSMKERSEEDDEEMFDEIGSRVSEIYEDDSIYLSGPIRCVEDGGSGWRDMVTEEYSHLFEFLNPLDKYDTSIEGIEVVNDPLDYDEDCEHEQVLASEIVSNDKLMIQGADFMLVGLPEAIARGTMMEVMYAYENDIPVFVWRLDDQDISPWTHHHAESVEDDVEFLIELMDRWEEHV